MYCFDTNIVIDIFRGDRELKTRLEAVQRLGVSVSVTTLTLCELFKGAYAAQRQEEALKLVRNFMETATVIEHTPPSCDCFGKDYAALKKSGKLVPEIDLMIGCIAKSSGKILVTRNDKDFRNIPDIRIEKW